MYSTAGRSTNTGIYWKKHGLFESGHTLPYTNPMQSLEVLLCKVMGSLADVCPIFIVICGSSNTQLWRLPYPGFGKKKHW